MLTGGANVEYGHEAQQIAGTPWSTRIAAGPAGRAALEIYAEATLVDVMVAPSLAPVLLRGARRVAWRGQMFCVAWGYLPAARGQVRAEYHRSRFRSRRPGARFSMAVPAFEISDHFWIATATGRFDTVAAVSSQSRTQCRLT